MLKVATIELYGISLGTIGLLRVRVAWPVVGWSSAEAPSGEERVMESGGGERAEAGKGGGAGGVDGLLGECGERAR